MLEIPLNAKVEGTDGPVGESLGVIVRRGSRHVDYLIVKVKDLKDPAPRLVEIGQVTGLDAHLVQLKCRREMLISMTPFMEVNYQPAVVPENRTAWTYGFHPQGVGGQTPTRTGYAESEGQNIGPTQLAVMYEMAVEATDGKLGTLDHLLADDELTITHFVLEERRFRRKSQTTLPVEAISHMDQKTVYLKLDQKAVASLPAVRVGRGAASGSVKVDLLGVLYEDPAKANEGLEFARSLHRNGDIKILDAAVLVKHADGKIEINDTGDWTAKKGGITGAVAGGLAGLVLGPGGVLVGALAGAGIGGLIARKSDGGLPDPFLQNMASKLEPGGSALVIMVEHQWSARALENFGRDNRAVITTELSDQLIAGLLAPEAEEPTGDTAAPAAS